MYDVKTFDLHFIAYKELDVNQTRRLFVRCVEDLLERVNSDVNIRPYLHTYPFTEEGTEIMISFFQPNGERVQKNYVALVHTLNGKIFYSYYNHKSEQLLNLHEESYQEALRICQEEGAL